jgi:hypothetical protein
VALRSEPLSSSRSRTSFSLLTWLPLGPIATTLFVTFAVSVVAAALPPQLLGPIWQLRLVGSLIDNAPVALLGLGLVHLQAHLSPYDTAIQSHRDRIARLAVAAAFGFLLLVPLQIMASVQLLQTAGVVQARRSAAITADYATLRQQILAANSTQDLQARLQRLRRLRAPLVGPVDRAVPLEPLRQRLLAGLNKARADALRQLSSSSRPRLWSLFTTGARNLVCSLAFAAGFAACARSRSTPLPLLSELITPFRRGRLQLGRLLRRRVSRRSTVVDRDYFAAIVDSEPKIGEPRTREPESR